MSPVKPTSWWFSPVRPGTQPGSGFAVLRVFILAVAELACAREAPRPSATNHAPADAASSSTLPPNGAPARSPDRDSDGCSRSRTQREDGAPFWPVWEFRALAAVEAPNLGGMSQPWDELAEAAKPRVVLTGRAALDRPPALASDRPWWLIVASFELADPGSARQAESLASELREQGWPGAEVIDSRAGRRLDCCYLVVSVGRYATKDAAEQMRRRPSTERSAVIRRAL